MPSIQANIKELIGYKKSAPQASRDKIQYVIDLYNDKKIKTFNKALNAVMLLATTKQPLSQAEQIKNTTK